LGKGVDAICGYCRETIDVGVGGGICGVGCSEGLRKVSQNGGKTVVFVEAGEGAGCELAGC
jgi:predicted NAD/FAD-dependent oxidoreductase